MTIEEAIEIGNELQRLNDIEAIARVGGRVLVALAEHLKAERDRAEALVMGDGRQAQIKMARHRSVFVREIEALLEGIPT